MGEIPLLAAWGLSRSYPGRSGKRAAVAAVSNVSFCLHEGEVVAVVGRSGSGKSTLARLLAGLEPPDAGEVWIEGVQLARVKGKALRRLRRSVQLVLQEPRPALDPVQSVGSAVAEPLLVHRLLPPSSCFERVRELLATVGLEPSSDLLAKLPHELSGGEAQRVLLARALACEPRVLLLDEPVSALDAALRRQVTTQLLALRDRLGLALLLIAHDLRVVAEIASKVLVMDHGRLVEEGPTGKIISCPESGAARALLSAAVALAGPGVGNQMLLRGVGGKRQGEGG